MSAHIDVNGMSGITETAHSYAFPWNAIAGTIETLLTGQQFILIIHQRNTQSLQFNLINHHTTKRGESFELPDRSGVQHVSWLQCCQCVLGNTIPLRQCIMDLLWIWWLHLLRHSCAIYIMCEANYKPELCQNPWQPPENARRSN